MGGKRGVGKVDTVSIVSVTCLRRRPNPVIIINQSQRRSDIIILHKTLPPSVISIPLNFPDPANQLKVFERLRQLNVPEKSRVWWCPTSAFCSLPLHALGPIPSDDSDRLYFMDLYVCSYAPTLSALIESRKPGSQPETLHKSSLRLVAQPESLHGAQGEINVVQAIGSPVTTLVSEKATPMIVVESLRNHRFVHFVCHGLLETGKPFDASFELHGDNLTLLEIVRSQLPTAEFAFLSACHTAEPTEDSISDEGLHLAAATQFCGFRSAIGTMWAMADKDGADLSRFSRKAQAGGWFHIMRDRRGRFSSR
ncbi:CHAT domain-containing protein [Lactarius pseudohatsudake]|nr:CHAT domain-containing protein [Lactarius pseudohatsudake]